MLQDTSASLFGGAYNNTSHKDSNRSSTSRPNFLNPLANFSALNLSSSTEDDPIDDVFRDYDNLFRVFYNYPPTLDPVSVANAYAECKSMLHLADMYDALEVIGPRVDHHLLRFQGRLWKQIAKYPPSYLKLGYLARSRAIFTEALVHTVGQWPQGENQLRGRAPEQVLELIEDKAAELEEMQTKIELKLYRLTLTTSRGERVTPQNAYLDWLAMSLFRQWLAERTTPLPAPILKEPARTDASRNEHASVAAQNAASVPVRLGRVFRKMGAGGDAYLTRDELKKFLKLQPEEYSKDTLRRFERRMERMKNLAEDVVRPLMRNFLELDLGRDGGGLPYFTCTKITEDDYPWDD